MVPAGLFVLCFLSALAVLHVFDVLFCPVPSVLAALSDLVSCFLLVLYSSLFSGMRLPMVPSPRTTAYI